MRAIAVAFAAIAILQGSNAEVLRARLHAYLTDYQPKLSALIADEVMVQQNVHGPKPTGGAGPRQFRTIRSEVAFIALPGDQQWLGFRRVNKVGNDAVDAQASSLATVLAAGDQDDYAKAKAMLAESARHNLGSPRTTNLPNLPLEFLHPRHAARFSVQEDGEERVEGRRTVRLVFVEQATPTLITAQDSASMRSVVTAWIERDSGRLWRADVITRDPAKGQWAFDHVVSVRFRAQPKLGLLVPANMLEQFFAGENRLGTSDASYTNYRRFQTSARIVPQP